LYTNSYAEHGSNSGTTLWNLGKEGKGKENDVVKHNTHEGRGHILKKKKSQTSQLNFLPSMLVIFLMVVAKYLRKTM
jgi:hypothetical protein